MRMAFVVVEPQSVATMTWMRSGAGGVLVCGVVAEAACGAVIARTGYLRGSVSRCSSSTTHAMLPRRSRYFTSTA